MKNTQQNTILMGVTAVCVVVSLILCGIVLHCNKVTRSAQEIQVTAREMQRAQLERQLLQKELEAYGQRNPDLVRLLNPAGAPPKPAAK